MMPKIKILRFQIVICFVILSCTVKAQNGGNVQNLQNYIIGELPFYWHDGKAEKKLMILQGVGLQIGGSGSNNTNSQQIIIQKFSNNQIVATDGLNGTVNQSANSNGSVVAEQSSIIPLLADRNGAILAPVGGVIVIFKSMISEKEIGLFFNRNGIDSSQTKKLVPKSKTYFIDTSPGNAALIVTRTLSNQQEIRYLSPNWWHPTVRK